MKGGKKMAEILGRIEKAASGAKKVDVGFMSGADYPDGTPVAYVAATQNFGAPEVSIPARPFFTQTVDAGRAKWGKKLGAVLKAADYKGTLAFRRMGEAMGDELRESIIKTHSPALSPVTLMLRKMYGNQPQEITGKSVGWAAARVAEGKKGATGTQAKPLIWTGHMLNSITYQVNGVRYKVGG